MNCCSICCIHHSISLIRQHQHQFRRHLELLVDGDGRRRHWKENAEHNDDIPHYIFASELFIHWRRKYLPSSSIFRLPLLDAMHQSVSNLCRIVYNSVNSNTWRLDMLGRLSTRVFAASCMILCMSRRRGCGSALRNSCTSTAPSPPQCVISPLPFSHPPPWIKRARPPSGEMSHDQSPRRTTPACSHRAPPSTTAARQLPFRG
jgi:hypothetical protein